MSMEIETNTGQDGYTTIRVKIGYGSVDLTPLEAEAAIKKLRQATNQAQSANRKPTRFGDH